MQGRPSSEWGKIIPALADEPLYADPMGKVRLPLGDQVPALKGCRVPPLPCTGGSSEPTFLPLFPDQRCGSFQQAGVTQPSWRGAAAGTWCLIAPLGSGALSLARLDC